MSGRGRSNPSFNPVERSVPPSTAAEAAVLAGFLEATLLHAMELLRRGGAECGGPPT